MSDQLELDQLRTSFREVLDRECDRARVLEHIATGKPRSEALWKLAGELGWPMLSIPGEEGGVGLGIDALCVLYRELGRSLAPLPLLGGMLGIDLLTRGASNHQRCDWLPRIADGGVAVAVSTPTPWAAPTVTLRIEAETAILDGTAMNVLDAPASEVLIISCTDASGAQRRALIDVAADGAEILSTAPTDQTRSMGQVAFHRTAVPRHRVLEDAGAAPEAHLTVHAALAIACDAIGGAEACLKMTLDYLKTRQQFGRLIGSFQALKHRCADHQSALVAATALLDAAIVQVSGGGGELDALLVKAYACEVYARIAQDSVQMHGGIGFTWEHSCHLFLKRAKLNQVIFGSREQLLDRSAGIMGS